MTEKEYFCKYYEACVNDSSLALQKSKTELEEGYKKLQAEYDSTIVKLNFSLEEVIAKRKSIKTSKTSKLTITMADIAIKRAEKDLEFGKITAKSIFEIAYIALKNNIDNNNISLEKAKMALEFAKAEKERGFTV